MLAIAIPGSVAATCPQRLRAQDAALPFARCGSPGKDPYVVEADNDNLVEYDTPAVLAKDCAGKSRAADTRLTQPVAQALCKVSVTPGKSSFGGFGGRILQFGNVVVGKTKTLPISITNVGGASCGIGSLNFVYGFGAGIGGGFCSGGT